MESKGRTVVDPPQTGPGSLELAGPGHEAEVLDWLAPTPTGAAKGLATGGEGDTSPGVLLGALREELAAKDAELGVAKSRIQSHRSEAHAREVAGDPILTPAALTPARRCAGEAL